MSAAPALSIVLPVYNEVDSLGPLWQELVELLSTLADSVEVIFVDDGSIDGSAEILQRIAKEDHRVRLIRFEANAGLSASFYAGLQATRGRIVATMDSDLQSDPRDIPMLMKYLDDADAVVGWRQVRHDSFLKRASSRIANGIRKAVSGDHVQDSACSLRVMRRECVAAVPPFTGMHRFMPTLLKIAGFRVIQVRVNHRARRFGRSKFGVSDRAFSAFADLLVVRWMMYRRLRYRIAETLDSTGEGGP
ncbi:MAG TPA: glycosyltransferase family 2 protein [Candidatus Acidoferrum sp.]|nr:glycosyltransferase family 2 protein [Candidatus Acidoferrum sp.]